jgi:hypothetical protein
MDAKSREKDWGEWQIITEMMAKVESTHSCTLRHTITASTSGYRSFVDVEIVATLPVLTGPGLPLRLSLLSHYPHPKHDSFAALLLELIRKIDQRIGAEVYKQRELRLTPPQE